MREYVCVCAFLLLLCKSTKVSHRFNISSMNLRVKTSPAKMRYGWTVKIAIRYYNKRTHLIIFFGYECCVCAEAHWIQFTLVHYIKQRKKTMNNNIDINGEKKKKMLSFFSLWFFFYFRLLKERKRWKGRYVLFSSFVIRFGYFLCLFLFVSVEAQSKYIDFRNNFVLPSICLFFFMCIPSLHENSLTHSQQMGEYHFAICECLATKCRLYDWNWHTMNWNWVQFWIE